MICEFCKKEHDGTYGSGRFCSSECAHAFSTKNLKGKTKKSICKICKKEIDIPIRANRGNNICLECKKKCKIFNIDCDNCFFKINKICLSKSGIKYKLEQLSKYTDFTMETYELAVQSYLELKNVIQNMIDSGLCQKDICIALFKSARRGTTIFKTLGIHVRNLSEAVANAYITCKMKYKTCYHTSWNNKEVFLRSSYELDYAKYLDEQKIDYFVENLNIKYWDTATQKYRKAIPDFYLPETNTIVEIKSSWTLDEQNMKDKKKAYLENGYNFKLFVNHKEYEI